MPEPVLPLSLVLVPLPPLHETLSVGLLRLEFTLVDHALVLVVAGVLEAAGMKDKAFLELDLFRRVWNIVTIASSALLYVYFCAMIRIIRTTLRAELCTEYS